MYHKLLFLFILTTNCTGVGGLMSNLIAFFQWLKTIMILRFFGLKDQKRNYFIESLMELPYRRWLRAYLYQCELV